MVPSPQLFPARPGAEHSPSLLHKGPDGVHAQPSTPAQQTSSLLESNHPDAAHERHIAALVELGHALVAADYDWVCPAPDTQALVNGRFINRKAHDLAGVFGWNRPCELRLLSAALPEALVQTLVEAGVLQVSLDRETVRSRVRFSSFAGTLVAHSAWPTHDPDAVAFGPDTYRFGAFLERELGGPAALGWAQQAKGDRPRTVVDLGCESGAAGVLAARLLEPASRSEAPGVHLLLTDTNPRALRFATANARLVGLHDFATLPTESLADVPDPVDLVLASPPYLIDVRRRAERDGGGNTWGTELALRTVQAALQRLAPGGRLLLCTGAPVVRGVDLLWQQLHPLLARAGHERHAVYRYQMIEPDVWSSALAQPAYAEVDRMAAVGLSVLVPQLR